MYEQIDKLKGNRSRVVANSAAQKKSYVRQGFEFVDNRPEAIYQAKVLAGSQTVTHSNNPIQLMKFRDLNNDEYDPELFPAHELQTLLHDWRSIDLQKRSEQETLMIKNRISQLELFIEDQQDKTGGRPIKAHLGTSFESKHVIHGNNINNSTVKESVDKSIHWDRNFNTVLHLSNGELEDIQRLAMMALSAQGNPEDMMVVFQVVIGYVSQYKEQGAISGVIGDFNIFANCRVTLGVILDSNNWNAKIIHLDRQVEWPPIASFGYTGKSVAKLWGEGPDSFIIA